MRWHRLGKGTVILKTEDVRAGVLTGFGINCDEEMLAAYRLAGAQAEAVHFNEIVQGRRSIHDFHVLNFPGGFSFGDDLGSGRVLAGKLRLQKIQGGRRLVDEIYRFLADGKYLLGICNGFQVLVQLGLLPSLPLAGRERSRQVSLVSNKSGRFEDRWCRVQVSPKTNSPFLRGLSQVDLPVRHGEGRMVFADHELGAQLLEQGLLAMRYVDQEGQPTQHYPDNPNGSELSAAALSDSSGQVLGMMPHPEAYLSLYNHPNWGQLLRSDTARRGDRQGEEGEGLLIFKNIVSWVAAEASPEKSGDAAR